MTTPSDALYQAFCEEPWAILESRLPLLLSAAMRGPTPELEAAIPGERRRSGAVADSDIVRGERGEACATIGHGDGAGNRERGKRARAR